MQTTYDGVGRIWRDKNGWYWENVYGDKGGPVKECEYAKNRLNTTWATKNKKRAGLYTQVSSTSPKNLARLKEQDMFGQWFELMRKPW